MTLAILILVGCSFAGARPEVSATPVNLVAKPSDSRPPTPSAPEFQQSGSAPSGSSSQPTGAGQTQSQGSSIPVAPAEPASDSKKPAPAPHPRRRKKAAAPDCVPASTASGASSSSTHSTAPAKSSASATASNSQTKPLPVCPPPKVIVRQGGTAEPTVELAGGAVGDQAAQERHTANEMLQAAEENLKKIEGQQLAANQQDMLKQIHQFMAQSKTAVAAGDLERGRTLAWKAQLLSEELANPQK